MRRMAEIRRNPWKLKKRVALCIGQLGPGEEAYDSNVGMLCDGDDWAEGMFVLTSTRTVFKMRNVDWRCTLPHGSILGLTSTGRSAVALGRTSVSVVRLWISTDEAQDILIDTSPALINNWLAVLEAVGVDPGNSAPTINS
jgi:hypothetical protein